ncbi:hypothetical protein CDD81_414 [Ophiocordyceps australis]|uniref:Uncharacterized protein n=1 Tax=Ophiocordyceps australis TaxID=1399860 RepID=A0A2C5X8L3_9HYPO|nr:hypothetical protein CDD81_414 [Ophiocordyceps australis]
MAAAVCSRPCTPASTARAAAAATAAAAAASTAATAATAAATAATAAALDAMLQPADEPDADTLAHAHARAAAAVEPGARRQKQRRAHAHLALGPATISSRCDDDTKASHGWRLVTDASTLWSRDTTPEAPPSCLSTSPFDPSRLAHSPQSRHLPLHAMNSLHCHAASSWSTTAPPKVTLLQPPLSYSTNAKHLKPPPLPRPSPPPLHHGPRPSRPRQLCRHHHDSFSPSVPSIAKPPPVHLTPNQTSHLGAMVARETYSTILQCPPLTAAPHSPNPLPIGHNRVKDGPLKPSRQQTNPVSESPASSTRPSDTDSESSASSVDDPIVFRNARLFPPQFPAPFTKQPSIRRSRLEATSRIVSYMSKHRCSQSPLRACPGAVTWSATSAETASENQDSSSCQEFPYLEVDVLWQKLNNKRANVHDIKRNMAQKRQQLKLLRHEANQADNNFMNIIRPMLVGCQGLPRAQMELLDNRMTSMQSIRDNYYLCESDYEALEDTMDDEANELTDLETRFFSLLAAGQARVREGSESKSGSSDKMGARDKVPLDLKGICGQKSLDDIHPLYAELTSAVGDLKNAREELTDLNVQHEQYEYEYQLHKTTGKRPPPDMGEFLEEYPEEHQRMMADVLSLEAKVQELKQECEQKRVMRKHMSLPMEYDLYPKTKLVDMHLEDKASILANRLTLEHDRFGTILSSPNHLLARPEPMTSYQALKAAEQLDDEDAGKRDAYHQALKEYSIDSLLMQEGEQDGKPDFINRWLLQQLQQSSLNVQLLRSVFTSSQSLKIGDETKWQLDVLHFWSRDSTAYQMDGNASRGTDSSSNRTPRSGTPQRSRAASDSQVQRHERHRIGNTVSLP